MDKQHVGADVLAASAAALASASLVFRETDVRWAAALLAGSAARLTRWARCCRLGWGFVRTLQAWGFMQTCCNLLRLLAQQVCQPRHRPRPAALHVRHLFRPVPDLLQGAGGQRGGPPLYMRGQQHHQNHAGGLPPHHARRRDQVRARTMVLQPMARRLKTSAACGGPPPPPPVRTAAAHRCRLRAPASVQVLDPRLQPGHLPAVRQRRALPASAPAAGHLHPQARLLRRHEQGGRLERHLHCAGWARGRAGGARRARGSGAAAGSNHRPLLLHLRCQMHAICAPQPLSCSHSATLAVQGACALPDGQFKCFLPSRLKRTCDVQEINLATGLGCTEKGRDVFSTQETCCTRLLDTGELLSCTQLAAGKRCVAEPPGFGLQRAAQPGHAAAARGPAAAPAKAACKMGASQGGGAEAHPSRAVYVLLPQASSPLRSRARASAP